MASIIGARPWGAEHTSVIADELVGAYQGLCVEWMAHLGAVRARMQQVPADSVSTADDLCLHRMLTGLVRHSKTAAQTASTVAPVWVPEPINAMISDLGTDLDAVGADIGVLSQLGPAGLVLFETPLARARESLPAGTPRLPEVDVDGILWFTKVPGVYRRTGMVLAPLTRSRGLQSLRGEAWLSSTLTEITCCDIESDGTTRIEPGMRALADVIIRMGIAVQRGDIRVAHGDGVAAGDIGSGRTPVARFEAA